MSNIDMEGSNHIENRVTKIQDKVAQESMNNVSDKVGYRELKDEIRKDEAIIKNFDEVAKEMSDLGMQVQDYLIVRDVVLLASQKIPYIFKSGDTKKDKKYLLRDFAISLKRVTSGEIKKSDYLDFLNFKNPLMYASGLTTVSVRYLGFTTVFERYYSPGFKEIAQYFIDAGEGFSVVGETVSNSEVNYNLINVIAKFCKGNFDPNNIKNAITAMCVKITELVKKPYDQIFFYSASKYEAFFQDDHYFRDELYTNSKRALIDYTDLEGQSVGGLMRNDIKSYIDANPGKRILLYTSTHGLETGEGVTSIFGSTNDVVFNNDWYAQVNKLALESGGSVYHDRCYGEKVSMSGKVGTNTGNYIGIYNRLTTTQYANEVKKTADPGTLFMRVKIKELFFDRTKVLNIPELNP